MKMINAIIRPEKADALWQALHTLGVRGMTVTESKGYGLGLSEQQRYRTVKCRTDFLSELKIEIAIVDEMLESVIATIKEVCATGEVGDGKIFVMNLEQVIRIRTGEKNAEAL